MVDIVIGPITMPDLSGLDLAAATAAIENAYLLLESVQYAFSGTPAGQVISQSPVATTEIEPNSNVTITVSLGVPGNSSSYVTPFFFH